VLIVMNRQSVMAQEIARHAEICLGVTTLLNLPNKFWRKPLACINCVLRLKLPTGGSAITNLVPAQCICSALFANGRKTVSSRCEFISSEAAPPLLFF
jgi:hypothetical protein